ncbi:MAG: lytic transglycosylase domain-containing protein [Deltaproteobacteria bacterium]|nr:MAG: lytic transglycosylase domain-containing protein [Deltaproteobacteria bacterium]
MAKVFFLRAPSLTVAILSLTLVSPIDARDTAKAEVRLAAQLQLTQLLGLGGAPVDWRQWDAFLTFVVKRFGQEIPPDLRESLAETFLDLRYELTDVVALASGGQNPVPQLIWDGWRRLSPILKQALPGLPKESADRYANFIDVLDQWVAVAQGSQLGFLQLSPDALRGLARILEPAATGDPIGYTLEVDNALRDLLGLGAPMAAPSPGTKQSWQPGFRSFAKIREGSVPSPGFGVALATEPDRQRLNERVPEDGDLESYLLAVRSLLAVVSQKLAAKYRLPEEHESLARQIIFAVGWQETCWRQFIKKGKLLMPVASASGALGLMQISQLGADIEYNGNAGAEISLYYLTRFAMKKNEDKQPGGDLARATYSAYNGGPRQLSRYRAATQNAESKKIDESFRKKFEAVSAGREMEVQSCYRK